MLSLCFGGTALALAIAAYVGIVAFILLWSLLTRNRRRFDKFLTVAGISSICIVGLVLVFLAAFMSLGCRDSAWVERLIVFLGLPLTFWFAYGESVKPVLLSHQVIKNYRFFGLIIYAVAVIGILLMVFLG